MTGTILRASYILPPIKKVQRMGAVPTTQPPRWPTCPHSSISALWILRRHPYLLQVPVRTLEATDALHHIPLLLSATTPAPYKANPYKTYDMQTELPILADLSSLKIGGNE